MHVVWVQDLRSRLIPSALLHSQLAWKGGTHEVKNETLLKLQCIWWMLGLFKRPSQSIYGRIITRAFFCVCMCRVEEKVAFFGIVFLGRKVTQFSSRNRYVLSKVSRKYMRTNKSSRMCLHVFSASMQKDSYSLWLGACSSRPFC